jgi:hypothetical protein
LSDADGQEDALDSSAVVEAGEVFVDGGEDCELAGEFGLF